MDLVILTWHRRDMHQLKEETAANSIVKTTLTSTTVANGETSTSSENEQKTLHWLQSSLAEMKGEIVDLNRSVNVSLQLQQQQEAAGQFHLMRSDVTALQAQAADGTAQRQQINQSIHQVQQDVERLDQRYQINAAQLERIENNVSGTTFFYYRPNDSEKKKRHNRTVEASPMISF